MKRVMIAGLVFGIIVALGCSIVPKKFEAHITIDIRQHIEEQASGALDFIEGKTDAPPAQQTPPPKKTTWRERASDMFAPMHVAYAAELKMTSPEISRLLGEMRKRNDRVQDFKSRGIVGEDNRGYLDLRDGVKLTDPNVRNEAQRVVAAENKDRKDLYQETAKINKEEKVSVSTVESIYAMERIKRAKPGELCQLPAKGKDFDAFKASAAGIKLGAECVPEAWVLLK